MEVSGRRANLDIEASSAEVTPLCEPCRAEGKELEAHGFCNNCKEYMCPSCIKVHGKLTATKHHNVLAKQKMPTHYPSSRKPADVSGLELCKDHPSEAIKFFCHEHGQLGCGDCIVLNHRRCKVDYIPEVASSFIASSKFKVIADEVAKVETVLNTWERKLISDEQSVLDISKVQLKKIKYFRAEINEYLDKREKALVKSIDNARKKDADLIRRLLEDIHAAKSMQAKAKARLEDPNKNAYQIYVTARHAQNMVSYMQNLIKKVETEKTVTHYKFRRDKETEDLLYSEHAVGTIVEQIDFLTAKWNRTTYITITTPEDTGTCQITCSALLRPGIFLLADLNNLCLKTLDLKTATIMDRLSLDGEPWGACLLPGDRAAVTLPGETQSKIQFISTGNALETDKCITVSAWCKGITHDDAKLYLTFTGSLPRLEVRTLSGDVLQTINNTTLRQSVFHDPQYLTTSHDDISTIYVSDNDSHTVVQLSLQGELLQIFSDQDLIRPCGLVDVGGGQVLVCSHDTDNVMAINVLDGIKRNMLKFRGPYSVAYCPSYNSVVIGGFRDQMPVYMLQK
ncbi:uncharacterized protein LOC128202774 [Mya arenaria]|uniref:uncharacterized protein LOC128202774 n=1 Tax=Mya arenaria TaxID=6604 RepID=UPI0022E117BB|nr:uncharacterized protein LOC128202774 [Mya arenaria]